MPDFDVFLCHNSADEPAVREIAESLRKEGLKPWLAVRELRPGQPWQKELEAQIRDVAAAAVFVGKDGEGPWQKREIEAFLQESTERGCSVIPVVLPDYPKPRLSGFLGSFTWVDFRQDDPDPLKQLIWGVKGSKPGEERLAPTGDQDVQRSSGRRVGALLGVGLAVLLIFLVILWRSGGGLEPPPPPPITTPSSEDGARVRGLVVDADGRALAGVRVSVLGYASVVTDDDGVFDLEAHASRGRRVRLRAEAAVAVTEVHCHAGSVDCKIRLEVPPPPDPLPVEG